MSKIFGDESSDEINLQENRESSMVFDSSKRQCSNKQSESNNLDPTVSSTTVLVPEYALQEPKNEFAIKPRIAVSSEVSSTYEQATLPQDGLKRVPNKSISDTLVKSLEILPHIKQTNQLDEPKILNVNVPAKQILRKILPMPVLSNEADAEIGSYFCAADFVLAELLDPMTEYCKKGSEDNRTLPANSSYFETNELNSSISFFPLPPTRSFANTNSSSPDQTKNIGLKTFTIEPTFIASGIDKNLAKDKVNSRMRTRRKSMYCDRLAYEKQTNKRDSINVSLAELKKCATSSRLTKRSTSMHKEVTPQPNKKNNYSKNMSLIKSIIEDSNTTDVQKSASSKGKATTKPNDFKPINALGRIPKIGKLTQLKHEATTRTKIVKKDTNISLKSRERNTKPEVKVNKMTVKIPQTKPDHDKISTKREVPDDTKQLHKLPECKVCVSPILFDLLSAGTSNKHNQDTSGEIVKLLGTTEKKSSQVADGCSTTEKIDSMQFCASNSTSLLKLHTDQPNAAPISSEDKSEKDNCKSPTEHLTQNVAEMTKNCDKIVVSTDANNQQTEIPVEPQSMESVDDKNLIPEPLVQPLQEITNDYVVANHNELVIHLSRVSKHQSRKSAEHTKISLTTLPLDFTSSNSNMDIDHELELIHGMASEALSPCTPLNLLPTCVDNGSLVAPFDQKPKLLTDAHGLHANEIGKVKVTHPKRSHKDLFTAIAADVSTNKPLKVVTTTKIAAQNSELITTSENFDHLIDTPTSESFRLKYPEVLEDDELEKPSDPSISIEFTTQADNSNSDQFNVSTQMLNDESLTSPLQTNRELKSAGNVMYYVEQAQDGSNEETMRVVRKIKKKKKNKKNIL